MPEPAEGCSVFVEHTQAFTLRSNLCIDYILFIMHLTVEEHDAVCTQQACKHRLVRIQPWIRVALVLCSLKRKFRAHGCKGPGLGLPARHVRVGVDGPRAQCVLSFPLSVIPLHTNKEHQQEARP